MKFTGLIVPELTNPKTLKEFQESLEKIECLVIDEYTMIDAKILSIIDERLKLGKDSEDDFGGIKIVLSGDPRQLPPCGGKRLWSDISEKDNRQTVKGILLYRNFKTVSQLTMSQRQEANSYFAGLCDRIGEACITDSDYEILVSLKEYFYYYYYVLFFKVKIILLIRSTSV